MQLQITICLRMWGSFNAEGAEFTAELEKKIPLRWPADFKLMQKQHGFSLVGK